MIYELLVDDDFEWINCVTDEGSRIFRTFDGSPRATNWEPVQVVRVPMEDHRPALPSDFPWLHGGALVMRRRAVDAMHDMLEAGGEILPLATDDGVELFALNVTRVLDALDEEHSDIERFPDSDKIMFVTEAAFHESVVRDVPLFKLPYYGSPIHVGEPFKQRVHDKGLVGLEFILLWSPEGGSVRRKLW